MGGAKNMQEIERVVAFLQREELKLTTAESCTCGLMEKFGLTSEEVAREMAIGALNASVATLAVANTGVADDHQEDEGGTQCYAYALMRGERQVVVSETVQFDGDRVEVRKQAARHGLTQLESRYAQLVEKLEQGEGA